MKRPATQFPVAAMRDSSDDVPADNRHFATPPYETEATAAGLRVTVYLPEVDPRAIELVTQGGALTLSAPHRQYVRANFSALHLESAQSDYRLHLRLGDSLDLGAITARYRADRITLDVPKHRIAATRSPRPRPVMPAAA